MINADIVCDIDLRRIVSQFLISGASALYCISGRKRQGTVIYNCKVVLIWGLRANRRGMPLPVMQILSDSAIQKESLRF